MYNNHRIENKENSAGIARPQSKYNNFRLHTPYKKKNKKTKMKTGKKKPKTTPICAVIKLMDMIRDLTSQMEREKRDLWRLDGAAKSLSLRRQMHAT